jgi:hypothetical protein
VESGLGEEFAARVAAGFAPLVVLLGQDRPDQADHGGAAGEEADDVGAAGGTSRGAAVGEDLHVQPLLRVVRPVLPPVFPWEGGEGQQIVLSGVQRGCGLWELGLQSIQHMCHLSVDGIGVGLFEDRPQ